jgi:hypothetical protein
MLKLAITKKKKKKKMAGGVAQVRKYEVMSSNPSNTPKIKELIYLIFTRLRFLGGGKYKVISI